MSSAPGRTMASALLGFIKRDLWKLPVAYLILLAVMAWLGRWTPDYLQGRDLWHFLLPRMAIAMVMLGVFAAFIRLVPAALLLAAALLVVGTISAIKREATGEPFQVSDLFLVGQTHALFGYVSWAHWLAGITIIPAVIIAARSLRFRLWSLPLAVCCIALLSTYRFEPVVKWIHDNSYWIGVENLTFSQAESERMNGLATHLYFSTAGLRLKTFTEAEVDAALAALEAPPAPATRTTPAPDIFIVLGEAWWRDPSDAESPLNRLVAAGFAEGKAISPVYGGTTPNAEFEVLTAVSAKSFMSGIIPFQHYVQYFTENARMLPRLLAGAGYVSHAYHNFEKQFWLRDQVYPRFGFATFDGMDDMTLTKQDNGWPRDDGLFAKVASRLGEAAPRFHYIVTVQTHGPYIEDKDRDPMPDGKRHPGRSDYRDRLSAAVDGLLALNDKLKARGRPYVIVAFGDHLPGLRTHQWNIGWNFTPDPRLYQVPVLTISNSDDATVLRDRLQMRPLFCMSPVLIDWLKLPVDDRYMRYIAKRCDAGTAPGFVPPEAVIQNQLFASQPR